MNLSYSRRYEGFLSLEENKAIVRRVFEAINTKNLTLLDGIMSQDFIDRSEQFMAPLWTAFPDLHVAVEDIIAEEENVWAHVREVGTHLGEFRGLAPTGKKVSFTVFINGI